MLRSLLILLAFSALVGLTLFLIFPRPDEPVGRPPACPFDQVNALGGTAEQVPSLEGRAPVLRTRYDGGEANGYARGIVEVRWRDGDEVAYGAELFLPRGFGRRLAGQVDLMRWDNYLSHPDDSDWGGISVFGSDGRARLVRFRAAGGGVEELVGPFDLPEGRWFRLDVRQRLGASAGASSVVELDGRRVGESDRPNAYGRTVERVRYGVVAIAAGDQQEPLEVLVHGAGVSTRGPGPGGGPCVTTGRTPPER